MQGSHHCLLCYQLKTGRLVKATSHRCRCRRRDLTVTVSQQERREDDLTKQQKNFSVTDVTDRRTDGPMDRWTDGQSLL